MSLEREDGAAHQVLGKRFGTAAIHQLCRAAHASGSTELWVYTGLQDAVARSFYTSLGFEVLGPASEYARGKTTDDSDIVLKRILALS